MRAMSPESERAEFPKPAATPVSGQGGVAPRETGQRPQKSLKSRVIGQMARSSLPLVFTTMSISGCLVTSTPDFSEPEQTPPFLVPATAEPRPTEVLIVRPQGATLPDTAFSAELRSEDAGQDVLGALLIDYGAEDELGKPYADRVRFATLPARTLDAVETRVARAELPGSYWSNRPGCHTVTMIVTHEFDAVSGCPERLEDSSQITWFVYACQVGEPCPLDGDDVLACPDSGDAAEVCKSVADESEGGVQ